MIDVKKHRPAAEPPGEDPLATVQRAFGSQASLTFTQVAAISGKSPSWWRQQARCGAVQTVQFGGGQRITPTEYGRVMREGIGPLRRLIRRPDDDPPRAA